MNDDYDAQRDRDDEMLADYHSDLIHEEWQELPKGYVGATIVSHNFDVEANFICDNCGKSGWFSVNVDEYIEGIDDPNILDD